MKNIASFKISNGNTLAINNDQLHGEKQINTLIDIVDQINDDFVVENQDEIWTSIPIEILNINNITPHNGQIRLTESLYHNWFDKAEKELDRQLSIAFMDNFDIVLQHRDLIMSFGEYFLLTIGDSLMSGAALLGGVSYPLGGLLEAWDNEEMFKIKDRYGHDAFVFRTAGFSGSGTNTTRRWVPALNEFEASSADGFLKWVFYFRELRKTYPWRLKNELVVTRKFLREIEVI
ncbi:hypothetical protein [Marinilabilia salmonicolor]|uniref:Uncharacterized protein n=1 Tax=Marinilabilia salmonicolor TaxID=989 RepID=A0A368VAT7_9BACT|nr:hypothetical protein [Marinilabilia salmonicolor]RCW36774.1 hypothetical protein DFO77_10765 [Marinilabilia salmonicolor]